MSSMRTKSAAILHRKPDHGDAKADELSSPTKDSPLKRPQSVSAIRKQTTSANGNFKGAISPVATPVKPASAMPQRRKVAFEDLKGTLFDENKRDLEKPEPELKRSPVKLPRAASHAIPKKSKKSDQSQASASSGAITKGDKEPSKKSLLSKFPNVSFRDFIPVEETGEDEEEVSPNKKKKSTSKLESSGPEPDKSGLLKFSQSMTPKEASTAKTVVSGNVGLNLKQLVHSEAPVTGDDGEEGIPQISLYEQKKLDLAKEELPVEEEPLYFGKIDFEKWSPLHVATKYSTRYDRLGAKNLIRNMKAKIDDPAYVVKCIATLGILGHFATHVQIMPVRGYLRAPHHDYDQVSSLSVALQKADAITAILQALMRYTADRKVALRGLWALEHVANTGDSRRIFILQGGRSVIQTVEAMHRGDTEIQKSIRILKKEAKTGYAVHGCAIL